MTGYIPVPRGKCPRPLHRIPRRPGLLRRLWGALRRRPVLPVYASAEACRARHPGCEAWRVEV